MLVLTDQMIQRARFLLKPPDLSDESLSADVIDEVVRRQELYLTHPRTAQVFRDVLWLSPVYLNRAVFQESEPHVELIAPLTERVNGLLASHEPGELPAEAREQIAKYLESI
jgi:trimethylamine:corrinoid methyltransferase-like protein